MTSRFSNTPEAAGVPAASGAPADDYALVAEHVSKNFAGTRALSDVSLRIRRGSVHALLGGNGSGKSTIIKILAGVHAADEGTLEVFGRPHELRSYTPATAHEAGLRFVHQDLGLFQALSVEENFALDAGYPTRGPQIEWRALRRRVHELLAEYELDLDPRTPVRDLRPSDQTMIAIARALQGQEDGADRILVLDEPTARLAAHESELLSDRVRRRAQLGQTVLLVSHRLREVLSVADEYTIYRDGRVTGTLSADSAPSEDGLIELMAGRAVAALRPTGTASHSSEDVVLEARGLAGGPVRGVDLTVHRGEIVGLAGLVGSGRSTILKMLFGALRPASGTMRLSERDYAPRSISGAMARGVALVPEDRGLEAAFPDRSVSENIAVAKLREYFSGWMPRRRENDAADQLIRRFRVKVAGAQALFSSMSGGNQQKVVLARWMQRDPKLILLDEPTQGVDVMSRSDIYDIIRRSAADGASVVVASSDMSELHALCDRVLVLAGGRIVDEVLAGQLDVDGLTSLVLREKRTSPTQESDR